MIGNQKLTILACFSLGFGVFWLTRTGYLPPVVSQILMVIWVLVMRGLAMPKAVEASKEAFGFDKPADGEDKDAAAATAAAATPPSGNSKAGRKAGGKQKQAAAAAAIKKDE